MPARMTVKPFALYRVTESHKAPLGMNRRTGVPTVMPSNGMRQRGMYASTAPDNIFPDGTFGSAAAVAFGEPFNTTNSTSSLPVLGLRL